MNDYQHTDNPKYACIGSFTKYRIIEASPCVEHPETNMVYRKPHVPVGLQLNYWHNMSTILTVEMRS